MKVHSTDKVRLVIPKAAFIAVFDECDGFDQDETGGRVIGTYREHRDKLDIHVTGIIEAGPQARRDGGGDIETYFRTVNHRNHNTSFFYALLVTSKHHSSDPLRRYTARHYIFRRGEERIYELHGRQVEIVDAPLVWPVGTGQHHNKRDKRAQRDLGVNPNRVHDSEILSEFYRGLRPFSNAKLGMYWRGPLELLDGSKVDVVLLEDAAAASPTYTVTLREPPPALKSLAEEIATVEFPSARAALITAERSCNRALYIQHRGAHRVDSSA